MDFWEARIDREVLLNADERGAVSAPKPASAKAVDPWLIWHLQRSAGATNVPRSRQSEPLHQPGFLLRRPGDAWPENIPVAPYYRQQNLEFATGSFALDTALQISEQVPELRASYPVSPQLAEVTADSEESPVRGWNGEHPGGAGVIIGFIDNGCAFGHPSFLARSMGEGAASTRVLRLWDQSSLADERGAPWKGEQYFGYGAELTRAEMNAVIAGRPAHIAAREMYESIGYYMREPIRGVFRDSDFTHGTHVMDIAAGSGAFPGVAPQADLIFVQLPRYSLKENTDQASARHILDGAAYIFAHAEALGQPAVVNISYNAFTGPHDGSSLLERGLDELIGRRPDRRCVIMSAGNGRKAGCHTAGKIGPKQTIEVNWRVYPGDVTPNFVEIWYPSRVTLNVRVIRPDGGNCTPMVGAGEHSRINVQHQTVGTLVHAQSFDARKQQILVALNPTRDTNESVGRRCAPDGLWKIELSNASEVEAEYHAWIERDNRGLNPTVDQSRFEDAIEESTIGGACTGNRTVVVGASHPDHKTRLSFSALGPSLNPQRPNRPDFYAPGSLRAAQALSAKPITLVGTSMSAAYFSGVVAYLLSRPKRPRGQPEKDVLAALLEGVHADRLGLPGIESVTSIDLGKALEIFSAKSVGEPPPDHAP
jgi:subtilisin family serine protease